VRVLAFLLVVAACSSDDDTSSSPPADCATQSAPLAAGVYPPDALPKGACSTEGEACTLHIGYLCAMGGAIGRIDSAYCACKEAKWSCAVTAAGPGNCTPAPPFDASTD